MTGAFSSPRVTVKMLIGRALKPLRAATDNSEVLELYVEYCRVAIK